MSTSFEDMSRWDKCVHVVGTVEPVWEDYLPEMRSDLLTKQRAVTWAHYPYRHWLTEFAGPREQRWRRKRLESRMFEVAFISAVETATGRREYKRFYVFPDSDTQLVDMKVGEVTDPSTKHEIRESFDFIVDNGLYVPNAEDIFRLDHALQLAHDDGVAELVS